MSEAVVTLVLLGFVVGGGFFIFWPDITEKIKSPRKAKLLIKEQETVESIYNKHYSKEDALIEVARYSKSNNISLQEGKKKIELRGNLAKDYLRMPEQNAHSCPMCGNRNSIRSREIYITCNCNGYQFREKLQAMAKEKGYDVW